MNRSRGAVVFDNGESTAATRLSRTFVGGSVLSSNFRFSLTRLLIATFLLAMPFAFTRQLGAFGLFVAIEVGLPLFVLALIVRRRDVSTIIRSYVFGFAGALGGAMLMPGVNSKPEDVYFVFFGAIVGWGVSALITQSRSESLQAPNVNRRTATRDKTHRASKAE
ncbi:MAG: hypothetical protein AAGG48_32185 [Planctomycetota bacterium]